MSNIYDIRKQFQYNLKGLPNVIQVMIAKLLDESEPIWKILNDNSVNAMAQDDLTPDEKVELIQSSKTKLDDTEAPFKLVPYISGQVIQSETTEIRMYPYNTVFNADGILVTQAIQFEVITHYNNFLINGGYRLEVLKQEIIRVLNHFNYEENSDTVGEFTFDNTNSRLKYYNDGYIGYPLTLVGYTK